MWFAGLLSWLSSRRARNRHRARHSAQDGSISAECPTRSLTFRRGWTGPSKPRTSFRTARRTRCSTTGFVRRYLALDVELIDTVEREK